MKQKQIKHRKKERIAKINVNDIVKIFEDNYNEAFSRKVTQILELQKKLSITYFCLGFSIALIIVNFLMLFHVI